jgi:hypothetical protein
MALQVLRLDGRVHDRTGFSCGVPVLDDYLRRRAVSTSETGLPPRMSLSMMRTRSVSWGSALWLLLSYL